MLNPFAPHLTEEIWQLCGFEGMLNAAEWPKHEDSKCQDSSVEIVVQVNGKIRAKLVVPVEITSEDAIAMAKTAEKVAEEIAGKTVIKELYVKGKLVNIVVK